MTILINKEVIVFEKMCLFWSAFCHFLVFEQQVRADNGYFDWFLKSWFAKKLLMKTFGVRIIEVRIIEVQIIEDVL